MDNTKAKGSLIAESLFSEAMSQVLGDKTLALLENLGPTKISRLNAVMLQALSAMDDVDTVFDAKDQNKKTLRQCHGHSSQSRGFALSD